MLSVMISACNSISPKPTRVPAPPERDFSIELPQKNQKFATKEQLEDIRPKETYQYRIGPGDLVTIKVWRRPELSQENILVSPDGFIAIPRIGNINVINDTPEEVQKLLTSKLEVFYTEPEVTVQIKEFHNNKAFVLGRVAKPGVINFPGNGTLLEGLALAGGLPDQGKMTRCSIIRGNNSVIWIDLQDLLKNGNMSLNAPIRNNDVIFLPELNDEIVYVMGEVKNPGAVQLRDGINVLKAIMLSGGMNKDANPENVFIIRQQGVKGDVIAVDLNKLLAHADFSQNFTLLPNDIVYISPTGIAKFNYTLEKITPTLQIMSLGLGNANLIKGNATIINTTTK
jgi:polysaccharide biosynthesis/export protein